MQFQDDLAGGVTLVRPALQSPDYVTGTSGWAVMIDGSAEFNDVVIRGAAVAGTLVAENEAGDKVTVTPNAASYVSDTTSPGIQFERATDTGAGASITEYDDGFDRGLIILSPSPLPAGEGDGEEFSYIQMHGNFATDPQIQLIALGTEARVWVQGSAFDQDGRIVSYPAFETYTPVVTSFGSATFSTRTGWWNRVGGMILFTAYLVVGNAGSGATAITITAPTDIDRTTRQRIGAHCSGLSTGTGEYTALCFNGGSGAVMDRLTRGGSDVTGAALTAGSIITITGSYREG